MRIVEGKRYSLEPSSAFMYHGGEKGAEELFTMCTELQKRRWRSAQPACSAGMCFPSTSLRRRD